MEAILTTADECRKAGVANVIMDLVNLDWIGSDGVGMLVALYPGAKEHNGKVVLANPGTRTADIMVVIELDQVFPNVGSLENAVEYLLSRGDGVGT